MLKAMFPNLIRSMSKEEAGGESNGSGEEGQKQSQVSISAVGITRMAVELNEGNFLSSERRSELYEATEGEAKTEVVGGKRKKSKLLRKKEERPSCVFGVDIHIDRALEASETLLVGRVRGRKFSVDYIKDWAQSEWKEAPGQPKQIKNLDRGWFCIWFGHKEHVD